MAAKPKRQGGEVFVLLLILGMISIAIYFFYQNNFNKQNELNYNEFISILDCHHEEATGNSTCDQNEFVIIYSKPIEGNLNHYELFGTMKNAEGEEYSFKVKGALSTEDDLNSIKSKAIEAGITYEALILSNFGIFDILMIVGMFILIMFIVFTIYRATSGGGKHQEITKSNARLMSSRKKFTDVAGYEEEKQELEEVIDFLKFPEKYRKIGARIPKGVLLVGPPGTGKTLLAKAVAGEAQVPFFSISGSDFAELYVGVGASRVRSLFRDARKNAPCIIFIDEIDTIGKQRGTGIGGGSEEREQTLNSILVELDGFAESSGIITMAATNRPDVLDPALLRPGRFDRNITVSAPDINGREAILNVHLKNKKLKDTVKVRDIAKRTPGFVGADLENLVNEAALLTARENKEQIDIYHLDEALDRVLMGPAKKSKVLSKRDRNFTAHHEAGHAVIGLKLDNANIVHKVTIIPRGQAGGFALMLPEEEHNFLMTKNDMLDRITGLLGGRVAEDVIFNEITTGAHNDFEKATKIARSMVTEYGMSNLGTIQFEKQQGSVFLGRDYGTSKNFSDSLALDIDKEVRSIIDSCYKKAEKVIKDNIDLLKCIAKYLLEVETLTKEDIDEIVQTNKLSWWEKKKEKQKQEIEKTDVTKPTSKEDTISDNEVEKE